MALKKESISQQLFTWAIEEMHYQPPPGNPLSPDDLQKICSGQLTNIWKYVIENVHSAETVKKVRGNLALRSKRAAAVSLGHASRERRELEKQRELMKNELDQLKTDIRHIEKDLGRLEDTVAKTDCSLRDASRRYHDTARKTALLDVFSMLTSEQIAVNEELSNRVKAKLQLLTYKKRMDAAQESYVSRETRGHCGAGDIETKCCRAVRETCEAIKRLTRDIVESSQTKPGVREEKDRIWGEVKHIMTTYPVDEVIQSLIIHTRESTDTLREKTAQISISDDAQRLRFLYEGGGCLKDMSSPPSALQGVRQLLGESQLVHVKKFFDTEKNLNLAAKLDPQIEACREKITRALLLVPQPGERDLSHRLVECSVQLAEESTALNVIHEEMERLQTSVRRSTEVHEKLMQKHQRIVDFRNLADKKQNLIRVLARYNSKASSRLDLQNQEIATYITETLFTHKAHTESLLAQQNDELLREMKAFVKLNLPQLQRTTVDGGRRVTTMDLSIHHNNIPPHTAVGLSFLKLSQLLDVPYYQGVESLFAACMKVKSDIIDCRARIEYNARKVESFNPATRNIMSDAQIKELCLRVARHDKQMIDSELPLLSGRVDKATQFISHCLTVMQLVKDSWEQPAQYCVPWVKVKDETLSQWLNQYTVLATQIRQYQLRHGSTVTEA